MEELLKQAEYCVIDDDEDVLEGFCQNLSSLGRVKGFTSAQSALDAFDAGFAPLVTVVDLKMPIMNGLDFLEACRRRQVPGSVILASGNAGKSDLAKAINFGASRFLEKPFSAVELRSAVSSLLPTSIQKKSTVQSELVLAWSKLSSIYYDLLVVVENSSLAHGQQFISEMKDKKNYLELKKQARIQLKSIEELEKVR